MYSNVIAFRLLIIFAQAFFGCLSIVVSAAEVNTTVSAEGSASYHYEEHHPTKLDLLKMKFCGGKNSDSDNKSFTNSREEKTSNVGDWTVHTDTGGSRGKLNHLVNQKLAWSSTFDQNEYMFHVRFKKKIGDSQNFSRHEHCNTRHWNYRVDTAASTVTTSVKIVVPDNTFIVRIRKKSTIENASYTARSVQRIGSTEVLPSTKEALSIGNIEYFFVKPGSEIQIEVSHSENGSNYELIADFEITFVGYNRCESAVATFKELSQSAVNAPVTSTLVTQGFKTVSDLIMQNELRHGDPEVLDKALLFIGCLTSDSVLRSLVYDNTSEQAASILNGIQSFTLHIDSVLEKAPPTESRDEYRLRLKPLHILESMARYSVSDSVINGLKPLCERYPVTVDGKIAGRITGYYLFRQKLDIISNLMGFNASGKTSVAHYFTSLAKSLGPAKGETYASMMRVRKDEIRSLIKDHQLNSKLGVVSSAIGHLETLPAITPDRHLVQFVKSLNELQSLTLRLNDEMFKLVGRFSEGSEDRVNVEMFEKPAADFEVTFSAAENSLKPIASQFSGMYADSFGKSLSTLEKKHLNTTKEWLENKYGGFLKGFVESNKGSSDMEKISKCIQNPVIIEEQ